MWTWTWKEYAHEIQFQWGNKYTVKTVFPVWKWWHRKNTFSYHLSSQLLWETNVLSQTSLSQILFTRGQNNKAGKSQKPDSTRDDMVPLRLYQPRKRKLQTYSKRRHAKTKDKADVLLVQNANFISVRKKCI